MSEAEEYEYDYSSEEDEYKIEDTADGDEDEMLWESSQDNPNAAPMNYGTNDFGCDEKHVYSYYYYGILFSFSLFLSI